MGGRACRLVRLEPYLNPGSKICSLLCSCCVLVQETLYTVSDEKGGCGIKAKGLYEQTNHFNFFFSD